MKWKVLPCFIILLAILLDYPSVVAHPLPIQHSQRGDGTPVYHWFADVPVLHKGDFWNYTVSATERNYDMDLNGYMNSTVVNITTLPTPRYIIRGLSHLEGEFKYLIFTIQVKVDILSETVVSASNLAQISSTTKVVLNLDPDPLSLGGTTWYNLTFRPPPEEIDFPLAVGKVWNYSSQVYDGSKTTYYNDTLEVRSILNRTVPAGEFTCAAIFSKPSGTYRYYSPEVRSVVETEVDMSTEDVDLKAHLRLKDYNIRKDCNITAVSPSPFETLPSKVVTVNFENLSGGERYYLWGKVGNANASLRITAPSGPDNSPSNTDFGSFGLVLYKGSTVLWTGSVVTHNYNIIARNRTPLQITMRENSTTHVFVDLRNPSTENLTVDYV
ncbi:MAG: hypothetical protein J7L88_03095, partial [Thermoplasmata archaeon]|nr:hypothetical protein [Thermoplasmata archaeon]